MANLGLPGADSSGAWVEKHLRGKRKPLEAKAGHGRAWTGLATARGGLRGGASPACGVQGPRGGLQLQDVALKVERN